MTAARPLEALDRLIGFGTATAGEVNPEARIWQAGLRPVAPGLRAAGIALTVVAAPGDNLALHRAIARLQPGDVLVVDHGDRVDFGPFGEIMALAVMQRGGRALITNGAVRDSAEIRALGLPVFCRGLNIRGTTKTDPGEIGGAVTICGIRVNTGDIVLADEDGIVSFPPDQLDRTLVQAAARAEKEAEVMRRIRAGETTMEIFNLQEGRDDR